MIELQAMAIACVRNIHRCAIALVIAAVLLVTVDDGVLAASSPNLSQSSVEEPLAARSSAAVSVRQPRINRGDLAWVMLELEEAVAAAELEGPRRVWINRQFDRAVSHFFRNQYSDAVRVIARLIQDLEPIECQTPMRAWLASTWVEIDPRVIVPGDAGEVSIMLRSLFGPPPFAQGDPMIELRLIGDDGNAAWSDRVDLSAVGVNEPFAQRITIEKPLNDLPLGRYRVELVAEDGTARRCGFVYVMPRPVDEIRRELIDAIREIERNDESGMLVQAVRIARARAALLKERPSPLSTIEVLKNLHVLRIELAEEIAEMRDGRDPYIMREGDHWRPAVTREQLWAMRVFAPSGLAPDEPLPLMIALHGAGGDENLFAEGYGRGLIHQLAERERFIVVSPVTYALAGSMDLLTELIAEMQRCYPIDEDRVYLIGHSLGAGTVAAALSFIPDHIAAACCIAGAGRFARNEEAAAFPPVLVIGAEHDFVVPARRVESQAQGGRERGLPVEYRLAEGWGHVLIVGGVLEDAVGWLLTHRRAHASKCRHDD